MSIAGARPNFMKLAAIARAISTHNRSQAVAESKESLNHIIVHTGQHYDKKMSQQFFDKEKSLTVGGDHHIFDYNSGHPKWRSKQ